jgi:glutamyl-tRNA reductase
MTGIDSMIVGEPDIFGQVKKSFQNSKEFLYLGSELEIVFNRAINLSKDIRSETQLSKNPLSIASLVESKILELEKKPILIIGGGDVGRALIKRLNERNYQLKLFNRSEITIENIKSNPLKELDSNISDFQIIVIAASADSPLFDLNNLCDDAVIFDLAIPRNISEEQKNSMGISILTLDEISEMVKANLKGREEAVKLAEDLITTNADSEFSKLKNRKNINNVQKKFHQEQSQIKDNAVENALKKLKDGSKPEDIIEGLAEEIASKNAFHVSKILDQSFSSKNRDN